MGLLKVSSTLNKFPVGSVAHPEATYKVHFYVGYHNVDIYDRRKIEHREPNVEIDGRNITPKIKNSGADLGYF